MATCVERPSLYKDHLRIPQIRLIHLSETPMHLLIKAKKLGTIIYRSAILNLNEPLNAFEYLYDTTK